MRALQTGPANATGPLLGSLGRGLLAVLPEVAGVAFERCGQTRILRAENALLDGDDDILQAVIGADKLNPAGRTALSHVLELRRDAARKEAEVARQRTLLSDVEQNEDRLRKNLAAVTTADPLRARLTKALDADETKIDQLRTAIDQAQTEADKSHRALADAVATLHI